MACSAQLGGSTDFGLQCDFLHLFLHGIETWDVAISKHVPGAAAWAHCGVLGPTGWPRWGRGGSPRLGWLQRLTSSSSFLATLLALMVVKVWQKISLFWHGTSLGVPPLGHCTWVPGHISHRASPGYSPGCCSCSPRFLPHRCCHPPLRAAHAGSPSPPSSSWARSWCLAVLHLCSRHGHL